MDEFSFRESGVLSRVQIWPGRIGDQNMPRAPRLLAGANEHSTVPMNILNEYSVDRIQTNAFVRGTSLLRRAGIWSLFLL